MTFLIVNTQSSDHVHKMLARKRSFAQNNLLEAQTRVKAMWLGASETGLFEIRLSGAEFDVLRQKTDSILKSLRGIPGIIDVMQDWENRVVRVNVKVDQTRARRAGITSEDVAISLNSLISGSEVTQYREGDEVIPIVLQGTNAERTSAASIRSLNIYSSA